MSRLNFTFSSPLRIGIRWFHVWLFIWKVKIQTNCWVIEKTKFLPFDAHDAKGEKAKKNVFDKIAKKAPGFWLNSSRDKLQIAFPLKTPAVWGFWFSVCIYKRFWILLRFVISFRPKKHQTLCDHHAKKDFFCWVFCISWTNFSPNWINFSQLNMKNWLLQLGPKTKAGNEKYQKQIWQNKKVFAKGLRPFLGKGEEKGSKKKVSGLSDFLVLKGRKR